jgi:serine/threonine protein kinase
MKDIDVGQVIGGKYALVRLIGAGAMGQVWVARHQALEQTFAVKLMLPPTSDSAVQSHETAETSLKRFENEARLAAALSRKSRHIASVTDYGVDEDVAYLVMELLEGDGLEKLIGDGQRLAPAEVSAVVTQIAKGLAVAHAENVMHRDLKPANVFMTRDEENNMLVKLLDFGIARMSKRDRLTMKGLVLGSPGYMSPEQAMAESPDTRADVWSLAVLAFEALAGVTPFQGKDPDETILRICNFQATPLADVFPEASEELASVFKRAFTTNLGERFQTAPGFAGALASVLPEAAKRLEEKAYPATARMQRAAVRTEIDGGVSLKIPLRPRKLLSAVGIGVGTGLAVAGLIVALRALATSPAPASATVASPATTPAPTLSSAPLVPPPPPPSALVGGPVAQPARSSTKAPPVIQVERLPRVNTPPPATATTSQQPVPAPSKSVDRSAIF